MILLPGLVLPVADCSVASDWFELSAIALNVWTPFSGVQICSPYKMHGHSPEIIAAACVSATYIHEIEINCINETFKFAKRD